MHELLEKLEDLCGQFDGQGFGGSQLEDQKYNVVFYLPDDAEDLAVPDRGFTTCEIIPVASFSDATNCSMTAAELIHLVQSTLSLDRLTGPWVQISDPNDVVHTFVCDREWTATQIYSELTAE